LISLVLPQSAQRKTLEARFGHEIAIVNRAALNIDVDQEFGKVAEVQERPCETQGGLQRRQLADILEFGGHRACVSTKRDAVTGDPQEEATQ
jgi:hypothetical protein